MGVTALCTPGIAHAALANTTITTTLGGTPAFVGSPVFDSANVANGASSPSGTVTFRLYGPGAMNCNGTAIFTSTVALNNTGTSTGNATSGSFTPTATGSYRWQAVYSGDVNNRDATSNCASEIFTVSKATPTLSTLAMTPVPVGTAMTDTATLTGGSNPTGTITFQLFAPGNTTCSGTPIFTSTVAVSGGTATSGTYTPTGTGTYRWKASYSGDANHDAVAAPCNAANESVIVTNADPTMTTQAVDPAIVGTPISDTATMVGGFGPTGTVTFNLYGSTDATCSGSPIFTSTVPLSGTTATSANYTPTAVGTYRWRATYSGDANNNPFTAPCNSANESTVVIKATPTLSTTPSGNITIGNGNISDSATISNGYDPTGTITFKAFGPNDPACSGTAVFTSTVAVAGAAAASGDYTPTGAGIYHWTADYSGDANNETASSACVDEMVTVAKATPTIATTASAQVVLGGQISDSATIVSGYNPTGTVTFNLYGPDDATCAGTIIFTAT
ncbi:MAG: Ig-like domain repeat protein, partial [Longispora sp.]|nr:Ig-like domain repeat protein [Longispora sp. (in: high G+C Gram-positive bacteria)]